MNFHEGGREGRGKEGGKERGRKEGTREGGREGGKEGGRERGRKEGRREGGRGEGRREGGKEGGKEGRKEGRRGEGRREGRREGERKEEGRAMSWLCAVREVTRSTQSVRSASCGCLNRSNFMIDCVHNCTWEFPLNTCRSRSIACVQHLAILKCYFVVRAKCYMAKHDLTTMCLRNWRMCVQCRYSPMLALIGSARKTNGHVHAINIRRDVSHM